MDEKDEEARPDESDEEDSKEEGEKKVDENVDTNFDLMSEPEAQSINFSKTLSYELYKLKDSTMQCLKYERMPLFKTAVTYKDPKVQITEEVQSVEEESKEEIAVTKKQLKNVRELYNQLASEKRKFMEKIYTLKKPKDDPKRWVRKTDSDTQTDSMSCTCSSKSLLEETQKLQYLMGLEQTDEYQPCDIKKDLEEIIYEEAEPEPISSASIAMKQAQKYLRVHKIFEFFQFLITHLLSATPDDPIAFLTNLLDKCLFYRGGFIKPPLLYEKKHLDCLFNLMDRLGTGFIDMDQYKTGMNTLGICAYDEKPPLNLDNMVSKEFFIEEAHDSLVNLLNDMVRRRWIREIQKSNFKTPPPTLVTMTSTGEERITPSSRATMKKL